VVRENFCYVPFAGKNVDALKIVIEQDSNENSIDIPQPKVGEIPNNDILYGYTI
jgi:hypothetical protein